MTTSVAPPILSAPTPPESRWEPVRQAVGRAPVFLATTVAAVGAGWLLTSDLLYLGGLLLAVIWASSVLARRRDRWLVVLAVLLVGLGGPAVGVRLAYQEAGVEVTSDVDLAYADHITTQDGAVVMHGDSFGELVRPALVAVDDSGHQAWSFVDGGLVAYWPLDDGSLVAAGHSYFQDFARVDVQGQTVWSYSVAPDQGGLVAMDDEAVVVQVCADGGCTWTGLDLEDGSERWEVTGPPAPAWRLRDGEWWNLRRAADLPPATSLFATAGASGRTELREAGTGAVVGDVAGDATLVLARDMAIVLDRSGPCRAELRSGGERPWATEIDCALLDRLPAEAPSTWQGEMLTPAPDALGVLVGDAWWLVGDAGMIGLDPLPTANGAGVALDLRTGAARSVPAATRTFGAGVVIEYGGDGITVRDPLDGARLWGASLAQPELVEAAGDLVVLRYEAPLLLGDFFDPGNRGDTVIEVREARTGDLVARLRSGRDFAIAGDRVFVYLGVGAPEPGLTRMVLAD